MLYSNGPTSSMSRCPMLRRGSCSSSRTSGERRLVRSQHQISDHAHLDVARKTGRMVLGGVAHGGAEWRSTWRVPEASAVSTVTVDGIRLPLGDRIVADPV